MTRLVLAWAAVVWTAAYAVVYVAVVHSQDDSPAWWYLAVLAVAAALVAAGTRLASGLLVAGAILLGMSALLGLLSVGALLLPAVLLAVAAVAVGSGRRTPAPM